MYELDRVTQSSTKKVGSYYDNMLYYTKCNSSLEIETLPSLNKTFDMADDKTVVVAYIKKGETQLKFKTANYVKDRSEIGALGSQYLQFDGGNDYGIVLKDGQYNTIIGYYRGNYKSVIPV